MCAFCKCARVRACVWVRVCVYFVTVRVYARVCDCALVHYTYILVHAR